MAIASGDDLVARYDRRRLADLVADSGTRVDPATVEDHANVAVALEDATDFILAAARVAARYTEGEITATNLAKRLCCDLAFGLLNARRGYAADEMQRLAPRYFEAMQTLELLRRGERIFDSTPHADAGLPSRESFRPIGSQTPSLLSDSSRYFGCRVTYVPSTRW